MINIQNIDHNECFNEDFAKKLDFKDIKLPLKTRDIHKIEKRNSIGISVYLCIKKCCEEKHVDLVLIGKEGKRKYVLIKDFSTFMYGHTLQHFCRYCFLAFSTEEILKSHIKDWFKVNGK